MTDAPRKWHCGMNREFTKSECNELAMNTKADLCFNAMEMAGNFGKARVKDVKRAGRIFSKTKDRGMKLRYNNLGDAKETVRMVCVDGSYGKLNKADRCGGKFIVLGGKVEKCVPQPFSPKLQAVMSTPLS